MRSKQQPIISIINMDKILFVALGGALGSSFRYILSLAIPKLLGKIAIWGTFTVNIIGALLIGILCAFYENSTVNDNVKLFLMVGILGGFTTFSSFALENLILFRNGEIRTLFIYIFATNILGLIAAFGGYYLSKGLLTNLY